MFNILLTFQIVVSFLLIAAIILQQRGSGFSGVFGGGGAESYHTKRGFEKILFISTIVLASLFLISTFVALLIR